ncbi:gamma-glutamyltransferase 5-like [Sinocyclocheilus grahami]|uniref:gamma-glutamyltransferase 5-like n=1 Tax=Sinocyclocheilus grahami TaxID=75366 RepID=UPI0007AD1C9A|nr:PREDICTED: gamma-glutamyltransferase 5-like [Sinocyclocheilus grahami]
MAKSQSRRCCFCILALVCCVVIICICIILATKQRCAFTHAAVSADSSRCSDIGRNMLLEGGSAVDAAIAALLCTSLVNPQSMGLGGGAIFTIMDKTVLYSSNYFVLYLFMRLPGSHWIGVPGELRGYEKAHQLYGKLPWAKLFEPSIKLAREGFPMPAYLSYFLKQDLIKKLIHGTELCELFYKDKTVLSPRDTLKFPQLAETMKTISKEGADAFYTGKIAKDLIQDVQERNGILSLEDLRSHWIGVPGELRGYEKAHQLYGKLPWAKLFEPSIKLAREGFPMPAYLSYFLKQDLIKKLIHGTELWFGSTVFSPKTGIILNNELVDFCGRADSVTPGEQPPSSMAPTILQSQKKTVVIGGSGGSFITTAMALSIMNHLWLGMNLNESIAAKIVFVDSNNNVQFEHGYDSSSIDAMQKIGHIVKNNTYPFFNVVNGISKEGQCISAVSDARKIGRSAGY